MTEALSSLDYKIIRQFHRRCCTIHHDDSYERTAIYTSNKTVKLLYFSKHHKYSLTLGYVEHKMEIYGTQQFEGIYK